MFVLSDGTGPYSFVRCVSVGPYRSEPDGGFGAGTEAPGAWAP